MTGPGRENLDTVYQLDGDSALSPEEVTLNAEIPRIAAEPQFRHPDGLGGPPGSNAVSPPISGDISIPVLSMHTLGELFVPFSMEQIYARRVADHGAEDLLVVRAIRDGTHCGFTFAEQDATRSTTSWRGWRDGANARPAGDDVLDPEAVADPRLRLPVHDRHPTPCSGMPAVTSRSGQTGDHGRGRRQRRPGMELGGDRRRQLRHDRRQGGGDQRGAAVVAIEQGVELGRP